MPPGMKGFNKNMLWVSGGIVLALTVVSGCLFQQNRVYESENRRLILQNDSIMSVNIELRKYLQEKGDAPDTPSSLSLKEEEPK